MINEAIVLAGGFGTRLREVVNDVPKPMAPVNGKPFLHYIFRYLNHYGIKRVTLSTGYLAEKISDYFGTSYEDVAVSYAHEATPPGTGGGIRNAMLQCASDRILVLNGDSFFDADPGQLFSTHAHEHAIATLALRQVSDASRYGIVELEPNRADIISFREKNPEIHAAALINGGVYILDRKNYLQQTPAEKNFSIEQDFFAASIGKMKICGRAFPENTYFIDIGIPDDYQRAQHEFAAFRY